MFWSRSAILLVVLIAALLNVAAGLSVSSAGAESAVSQLKNEVPNSAPVASVPSTTGSSQAVPPLPMKVNHQVQLQRRNKGKKPGHVKNASRTEGPSGQELIPQELGGWIYADSADPRRIKVVDAPKDRSRPSQDKPAPAAKGSKAPAPLQNLAINLENPQAGGVPANYVLVANYHTHPSQQGDPKPSGADIRNAWSRGVPGLVIARTGIYIYGPARRETLNPATKFYPNTNEQGTTTNPTLVPW